MLERDPHTQAMIAGICAEIDAAKTATEGLESLLDLMSGEHDEYENMLHRLKQNLTSLVSKNGDIIKIARLQAQIEIAEQNLAMLKRNVEKLERISSLLPEQENEDFDGESEESERARQS